VIKVGIDWHADHLRVVRMIDGSGPEPAQRFQEQDFLKWVEKQLSLAAKVYTCYEAGAGGYVLHRQITAKGATNYVVVARKLDPAGKRVQTDRTDARELTQNLDRYVRGNPKAMQVVRVPTPEEEQKRAVSRQRQQICTHRHSLAAQGSSLLLSQGLRQGHAWWKASVWKKLLPQLPAWIGEQLAIYRRLILSLEEELKTLNRKLTTAAAAKPRPKGMGALTLEILCREICTWARFNNRKGPGSYAGLTGGVSASSDYQVDLPITKAGNPLVRYLIIELAWRMVRYQPQSQLIRKWRHLLLNPRAHRRLRKRAIVAVGRQLMVDLWRWQTGRVSPEQLGWVMTPLLDIHQQPAAANK
jgi:transposase